MSLRVQFILAPPPWASGERQKGFAVEDIFQTFVRTHLLKHPFIPSRETDPF
jgi:hypothetical protein